MTGDQLRMLWTSIGGVGTLAGLAGMGVMLWLLRDAWRYDWALRHIDRPGLAMARRHVEDDLWDHWALLVVMSTLLLAAMTAFGAGVMALLALSMNALLLLVGCEVLLVAAVIAVTIMGVVKMSRRQAFLRAVQLQLREADK